VRAWLLFLLAILCPVRHADAHVGPPFPILVDQPIPGYLVTVWADPDVGEAVFHVVLEPSASESSGTSIAAVDLWVEPVSGRLPKALHHATMAPARRHLRFTARPAFDAPEPWIVGVEIRRADGATHSMATQVAATPPGLGPWDLLIYLFPFVLFGGLWVIAFVRRMRARPSSDRDLARPPAHSVHASARAIVSCDAGTETGARP
jgi:hypothetical protein